MKRDRGLPALEIELQPIAPTTGRAGTPAPPPSTPPRDRRRQFLTVSAVAATVIVLVALSVTSGDDRQSEDSTPAPESSSAPNTVPTTIRTPTPNLLETAPTNLLLWTFDDQFHLQTLDLDTGELRPLGVRGGFALFPMFRNVVVFDGDNGSRIVSAIGVTSVEGLGPATYPIIERDGRKLWAYSEEAPRRWERRAIDGTILDVLPFDGSVGVLPYNDNAVLLRTQAGTSLFDLVTRQQQLLTPVHAVAAAGNILLGRTCTERLCNLTVIDLQTRAERTLISNIPLEDANNATLSPDGAYLAITNKGDAGRRSEIVAVNNGTTVWKSPIGAYGSSAWSWSPDSKWFLVALSGQQVLAVSMRNPSAQTEIPLTFTPLHGLAVTYR